MKENPYLPPNNLNADAVHIEQLGGTFELKQSLKSAATMITVLATLQCLIDLCMLGAEIWHSIYPPVRTIFHLPEVLVLAILHSLQLWGGLQMRRFRSFGWSSLAAVTLCIPCMSPFIILGIPLGLWTLSHLKDPKSRQLFVR